MASTPPGGQLLHHAANPAQDVLGGFLAQIWGGQLFPAFVERGEAMPEVDPAPVDGSNTTPPGGVRVRTVLGRPQHDVSAPRLPRHDRPPIAPSQGRDTGVQVCRRLACCVAIGGSIRLPMSAQVDDGHGMASAMQILGYLSPQQGIRGKTMHEDEGVPGAVQGANSKAHTSLDVNELRHDPGVTRPVDGAHADPGAELIRSISWRHATDSSGVMTKASSSPRIRRETSLTMSS